MDVGQLFNQIPRFTRYWLTATITMSLLTRFGILPPEYTFLSSTYVFGKLQLWRCVTSLVVAYPLSFHFLINCYFIVQYSGRLEKDQFGRSPSDFLYLLLIVSILANVGGMLFSVMFLIDILVVAIVYIWCHLNKEVIVTFWFGTRFKAMYLPWILAAFELVFSHSLGGFIGIFIGHTYYFLKFQYPQELGGNAFLETPNILKRYVPDIQGGFSGFGVVPESRAQPRAANDPWGRGNTLGN